MTMKHQAVTIAKGVGIGLAVGGALGAVGGAMAEPKYARQAKRSLNRVLKTVGGVIEAIA
ncbi:MAG: hypothetical protein FWE98_00180 [Oscillospiraceae bacterium]|nr:hypothetical protein [Oscillospiraceae bacterium]